MEAYLDNSATTKCLEEVVAVVEKTMREDYGNPSARHAKGMQAEHYLKQAREEIAKTLKTAESEIYFTSGGTEADNWALIGAALANRRAGNHLITTAVEHAAVLQPMAYLEELGFRVTYLPVDSQGCVSIEDLRDALDEETILVSMMYVNNEVGTAEPVEEASKLVKAYNPRILFHVDAIQAYGKYRIHPKRMGIDLLSVSGHKIHGPKGIGFLYAAAGVKIKPLILGGGQQKGMRSGTDNVPGAAGLGTAARLAYCDLEEKTARLWELKNRFLDGISGIEGAKVQGQSQNRALCGAKEGPGEAAPGGDAGAEEKGGHALNCGAPHIVSVSFPGVRSEVLLHALEERGVYVSAGSACSSNKKQPYSPVLKAMGLPKEFLESTLRFSFSSFTTIEEIDYCLAQLREILPMLRKYTRH